MSHSYITSTGSFLPGDPVANESIGRYLGRTPGERRVRSKILRVNGIQTRHYALDRAQNATHSVYELASAAIRACVSKQPDPAAIEYLAAGSTHTPLLAPGIGSLVHDQLHKDAVVERPLEISSSAGICSSGAQALVNADRAVKSGDVAAALAVGVEQSSVALKSKAFRPSYDLAAMLRDVRRSKWFMSVFLRFMLSDGAGAVLLQQQPHTGGRALRVDWSFSRSFANEAPLCMYLQSDPIRLSQDVTILARYMEPLSLRALEAALQAHNEQLSDYSTILPHLSSYYFEPVVQRVIAKLAPGRDVPYWTNLQRAGNTGAASIYIMLDEYLATQPVKVGDRLLLFVPESGQFNFVIVALTVVS